MLRATALLIVSLFINLALAADFSGTYKGSLDGASVTLELKQSGTDLTGTASISGVKLDVKGTVDGSKSDGTIMFLSEKLHYKAELFGQKLSMKIAEEDDNGKPLWAEADTVVFTREGGTAAEPEVKQKFSTEPIELLKSGKEYVHASGGKFRYPAGWTVKTIEGGVQLVPNDAQAEETILILADSAEGKTDAADPEVIAFLDEQVQSAVPGLKRNAKIERAAAGNGKGAILTWDGNVDGKVMRLRAYVTIVKNYGVALIMAGTQPQVEARDKSLRQIFFSLGWGQGKIDSSLVGTWKYYGYNSISHTETSASAILRADGTFSYSSNSETNNSFSGKDSLGNELWTGWAGSRGGSGYDGRWIADGTTLTLNFEDGTSDSFQYELVQQGSATVIKLHTGDKKPMEWAKQS